MVARQLHIAETSFPVPGALNKLTTVHSRSKLKFRNYPTVPMAVAVRYPEAAYIAISTQPNVNNIILFKR
jgi:hypothetical protein